MSLALSIAGVVVFLMVVARKLIRDLSKGGK